MNAKAISTRLSYIFVALLAILMLTACPAASAWAGPAPQAADLIHVPVILRMVERDAVEDGVHYFYKDIYFQDTGGDAAALANRLVATDPEGGLFLHLTDDVISVPASQQMQEGLVSSRFGCPTRSVDPFSFTVEDRVVDRAGNSSGPVSFTIACPATIPLDRSPLSLVALVVGVVLLLAAGVYIGLRRARGRPLLLSAALLLCSIMTVAFAQMVLHEAGHALMDLPPHLARSLVLYVHPFIFAGYSRPMFEWADTLAHAAGALVAVLGAMLISVPFWRRRSLGLLAVVMLFPWSAINNGGYIASVTGDFHNIMQITGLPPVVFIVVGALIALVGLLMLFALLPLIGLPPSGLQAVLVLPAALFAWGLLSRLVAVLLVPGSPFATRWHLEGEILLSSNEYLPLVALGLLAALLYVTLYRRLQPRLPAWLRSETAAPGWKDMRLPGLLWAFSLVIGLAVVIF